MLSRRLSLGSLVAALLFGWASRGMAQEQPAADPYSGTPYPYSPDQPPPEGYPPPSPEQSYPETDPSALSDFRGALDPYGRWLEDPTYGTVWVPSETRTDPNFQPYVSAGRWTYDNGWTWVSDYPWGWVPFHYGRWAWIPGVGWAWVPGRAYSGAWVDWRVGDGYVGWGPLPPEWVWRNGVAIRIGPRPVPRFYFSRRDDLFAPRIGRYVVRGPGYVNRTVPYVQVAPPAYRGQRFAGPAPGALGIPPARVVGPPPTDVGLARARRYARPAQAAPPTRAAPAAGPAAPPARAPYRGGIPDMQRAPPQRPSPPVHTEQPPVRPGPAQPHSPPVGPAPAPVRPAPAPVRPGSASPPRATPPRARRVE